MTRGSGYSFPWPYPDAKFEYCEITVEVPKPIDYEAHKKYQPWPFNKPDFIVDLWIKPVKPVEYIDLKFTISNDN